MQLVAAVVGDASLDLDDGIEVQRFEGDADAIVPSEYADVVIAAPSVDPSPLVGIARVPVVVVGDPISRAWRAAVIERARVHHLPTDGELSVWLETVVETGESGESGDRPRDLFETVVEYADAAICVYDPGGTIRYANPAFAAFEERSVGELHGKPVWTIAAELEPDRFDEYWASFEPSETRTHETTHAIGDDTTIPVEVVTTRTAVAGEPMHVATVRSTARRERVWERVREQRRRLERLHAVAKEMEHCDEESEIYQLAADAAEDIIDLDLCTIGVVRDGHLVLGASTTELPEDGYREPPVDTDDPGLAVKTYRTGESYVIHDFAEAKDAKPEKDWRSGISVPMGEVGVFQAVAAEVGAFEAVDKELIELLVAHVTAAVERIRSRESLRESRRQLSTLISNLQGMAYSSPDGTELTFASEGCKALTGHDPETLESTGYDEVVHPEDRAERTEQVERGLAADDPFQVEYRIRTADGDVRWVWEQGRGIYDGDELVSVEGFVTDVSERKRRQDELERQNERLDRFASAVSHDLRNPLSVARGYLEPAARGDETAADEVRTSLDRMERIVEDVLELARQGQTIDEPDTLDLESAARRAWTGVDTSGLELVVVGEGRLRADEDRFRRLLENCYVNAVTHAEGATTVRVGLDGDTLFVEDDGHGFPEEDPDQVFESGYTTAETGTGFGLAIVKDIAQAHGWTARATRAEGGGARLEFEL